MCLSWLECCPIHWKTAGSIPSQGTYLGCRFSPQSGFVWDISHINVCLPLSVSLFPSLYKHALRSVLKERERERRNSIWKRYSKILRFTLRHRELKFCQGLWLRVRIQKLNWYPIKTQSNLSKFLRKGEQETERVLLVVDGTSIHGSEKWTLGAARSTLKAPGASGWASAATGVAASSEAVRWPPPLRAEWARIRMSNSWNTSLNVDK